MLLELNIRDFAIIDDIKIEFTKGFNVLTGETGSGKSIIIDALSLLLGGRANKDFIRKGKDFAYIEGLFDLDDNVREYLKEIGYGDEELLIVSREINATKPSTLRINGRLAPVSQLKMILDKVIDIFAQEESQSLMDLNNQRTVLDFLSPEGQKELLNKMAAEYEKLRQLRLQLEAADVDEERQKREIDILEYQVRDIEEADLKPYDFEGLYDEYKLMSNSEKIKNNLSEIVQILKRGTSGLSAIDSLDSVISHLSQIESYQDKYGELKEQVTDLRYQLDDLASEFENNLKDVDIDEREIDQLINRIDRVNSLKSKYGETFEKIEAFKNEAKNKLEFLKNLDEEKEKLISDIETQEKICEDTCEKISANRLKGAEFLNSAMKDELNQLNMPDADFKVKLDRGEMSSTGFDKVEFLIKTNRGEDFKSLARTASGGEMSRIMLGFKSIIAQKDNINTLVFDEIDTGISGVTAQIVGNKIRDLSKFTQVIAISHLPQIVSMADTHFLIEKSVSENVTTSSIRKLSNDERVEELARLLGGMEISETTIKAAREMIEKRK